MPATRLPETDLRRIEKFCEESVPAHVRDQVLVEHHVRGRTVTICETRAPWDGAGEWTHMGFAQMRYREADREWNIPPSLLGRRRR